MSSVVGTEGATAAASNRRKSATRHGDCALHTGLFRGLEKNRFVLLNSMA